MQDVTVPTDTEIEEINPLPAKRVDMTLYDLVRHITARNASNILVSDFDIQLYPFDLNAVYNGYWDIKSRGGEVAIANEAHLAYITQDGELATDWRKRLMEFWLSTVNGLEQLKKIYLVAKMNYKTDVHISFEDALEPMVDYCTKYGEELTLKNNFGVATDMCTEAVFNVIRQSKRTPDGTKQAILNLLKSRLESDVQNSLTEKMILSGIREEYHPLVTKNEMLWLLQELKNERKVVKLNDKFDYWEAVKNE